MDDKCTKCGGRVEEGFMLDAMHGGYKAEEWVEGAPERSFWTGVKVSDRSRYKLRAFRCTKCGHLELYAPDV